MSDSRQGRTAALILSVLLIQNSGRLLQLIHFYHRLFSASAANAVELNYSHLYLPARTLLSCSVSNTGVEISHEWHLRRPGPCQTLLFNVACSKTFHIRLC